MPAKYLYLKKKCLHGLDNFVERSNENVCNLRVFSAPKILCQSVVFHIAFRNYYQWKIFGHGISKRDKVGNVQVYPMSFSLLCRSLILLWSRLLNFDLKF